MGPVARIWVYLSATPLLWLAATLLAYQLGAWLFQRSGSRPVVNPVAIAVALVIGLLLITGTPYETYFEGAQFVHFLLGPATVALAVPLYQHRARVRQVLLPMIAALLAGSATAILSAVLSARLLGASEETLRSIAPKSATTPIAMGIAEQIGGQPSLAAAFVVATGLLAGLIVSPVLNALRIRDQRGRGFSAGVAAHGMGTALALQESEVAGTFAGIGLALNGVATAILVPLLLKLLD